MASGIAPAESGPAPKGPKSKLPAGKLVDYGQYIDGQLRRTRGQVKVVEIAQGLANLTVGVMAFFLVAICLDHWIIRGGLGVWGRTFLLAALVCGALYYFARAILPALVQRVNPIYAAHTIERTKPTLKNGLINLLLFRRQPEIVPQVVYHAVEEQAAAGLLQVPIDTVVDRTQVIHRGYWLVALAAVLALYFVVSPKNPLVTIERVMLPWSDVAAPARVSITDIQPGSANAFRGQPLKISAEIVGLSGSDEPKVLYTTADRQAVDRPVLMTIPGEGYRYVASLPEGDGGVQQDLEYRIVAGDATSSTYRLTAVATPAIVVDSVDYHYPAYTGMESVSVKHRGDLKALEGTQVTVHAVANQPIRSASVDFNCDGKPDRGLKVEGENATITFPLALNSSRTGPLFDSYQLQFVNEQNVQNPQPVRHSVEVVPDLPPEVTFVAPTQEEITVPLNGRMTLEVRALDPDFALTSVVLRVKTDKADVIDAAAGELLKESPHIGPFVGKFEFVPEQLGLHEGDVVRYQAVALDNKSPEANQTTTGERRIRIAAAEAINPRRQNNPAEQNQDNVRNQQSGGGGQNGNQHPAQNQGANRTQQSSSNQQPGKQEQQSADRQPGVQQNANNLENQPEGARPPQDSNQQNPNQNADDGQRKNQKQSDSGDSQQTKNEPAQSGSDSQSGQNDPSKQQNNSQQSKQNQSANDKNQLQNSGPQNKNSQGGDQKTKDQQSKDQPSGSKQSGDKQSGDKQSGGQANNSEPSGQKSKDGQSSNSSKQEQSNSAQGNQSKSASQKSEQSSKSGAQPQQDKLAQNDKPVPSDGSDDGSGVERILQHQQKESGNQSGKPEGGKQSKSDQQTKSDQQAKGEQQGKGDQQSADQQAKGDQQSSGQQQAKGEPQQPGGQKQAKSDQQTKGDQQGKADQQAKSQQQQNGDQQSKGDQQAKANQQSKDNQPGNEKQQGKQEQQAGDQQSQSKQQGEPSQSPGEKSGDPMAQQNKPSTDGRGEQQQQAQQSQPEQGNGGQANSDTQQQQQEQQQQQAQQSQRNGEQKTQPNSGAGDSTKPSGSPSAGQQSSDSQGSPQPDQSVKPENKSGNQSGSPEQGNKEQSPSISNKESNTQGQEQGDRSGNGGKGGGQPSKSPGTGSAGQNTASDQGGGRAESPGNGETSNKGGGDQQSDHATGHGSDQAAKSGQSGSASRPGDSNSGGSNGENPSGQQSGDKQGEGKQASGQPSSGKQQGGDQQANKQQSSQANDNQAGGNQSGGKQPDSETAKSNQPSQAKQQSPGNQGGDQQGGSKISGGDKYSRPQPGQNGAGNQPNSGEQSGGGAAKRNETAHNYPNSNNSKPGGASEGSNWNGENPNLGQTPTAADDPNLAYAKKATELALDRLKQAVNDHKHGDQLLKDLGWTREEAEQFMQRQEKRLQDAAKANPNDEDRKQAEDALRSLGLRPPRTDRSGNGLTSDEQRGMATGRHTSPPPEYMEQYKAFSQGVNAGADK